jgi:hypothetical protein
LNFLSAICRGDAATMACKPKKRGKARKGAVATREEPLLDRRIREFLERDEKLAQESKRRVEAAKKKAGGARRRRRKG